MKFTAGEAVVKSLEIEGVTHAFGIIGGNLLDVFDLIGRSPHMTYVGVRHEETASHMAHAFARASGKMAVCLVQNGAGTTNLATGFATASKMHAPILAITGAPSASGVDNDGRHEIDQVALMAPVTRWSARVPTADRIPEFLQRAFRVAMTPPRGPVFLEIPSDVLRGSFEWEPPGSRMSYRASYESSPDPEAVAEAARMIAAAKRPVFVMGQGGESEAAWEALAAISESGSIPLCNTFGHNSAIPATAPLALGGIGRRGSKAAMNLLPDADLVVIVGSRFQRYTIVPYYGHSFWPSKAKIIQIDSNALSVGRHLKVDIGIAADATKFLTALRKQMDSMPKVERSAWRTRIEKEKAEWEVERQKLAQPPVVKQGRYLNPAAVYDTLGKALPKAIYVGDVGSTTQWTFCMIKYGLPKGFIYTGALAGLGFGMPGALGAKLARPECPVVGVLGDGAFSLSLPALITAVEHKIPVRLLVCDNASWGAEKGHQMHWFDRHYVGANLDTGDLVEICKAIGAKAVRVTTIEELVAALKDEPKDGPTVIIAPTDPDDFPEPVPHSGLPARSWMKDKKA